MAVLKYKDADGVWRNLIIPSDSNIKDLAMSSTELYLIDNDDNKFGDGIKLEELASEIAENSNSAGGIVEFIEEE